MTALALEHGAINLSQGFPDFEGPSAIVDAAVEALRSGHNQYPRSMGVPRLAEAIAGHQAEQYDLHYDPMREVVVFSGATEGIASSLLGLVDPGDEVVVFEPFYDSYPACIALAGGIPRFCTLRFPDFALDEEALAACFSDRTKLVLLNTPHNPTGKVFDRRELSVIAELCRRHEAYVVSDEVYEHLTYGVEHVPMASVPGMRERTLTLSSAGKTYSFTGWKIGWATGPEPMVAAAQAAHQFVTFASAAPLQHAAAFALESCKGEFYAELQGDFQRRRDFLSAVLREVGFEVASPQGTYFILADFRKLGSGDDRAFAKQMIASCGVAAIPPSVFYRAHPEEGARLVRFAFCKRMETLEAAAERLGRLRT
ncbi:MAG: aminotransferase class I/II-fold pyridoxal phosphate-dependent enzyme [Myxococcota bacterium]